MQKKKTGINTQTHLEEHIGVVPESLLELFTLSSSDMDWDEAHSFGESTDGRDPAHDGLDDESPLSSLSSIASTES